MPPKTEFRELMPLNYTTESIHRGLVILRGKYQQADEKNANKRIYPRSLWEKVLNSPAILDKIEKRGMYGELEHPTDGVTKFPRVSHIITDLKWGEGGAILGAAEILPTPNGEILRALAERKTLIGVSSRGFGFSDFDNNADAEMVRDDFDLDTFDFVCAPSTTNAYATPSYESRSQDMLGRLMRVAHAVFAIKEFPLHERKRDELLQELAIIRSDPTLYRVCDAIQDLIQEARMGNKMISVPTLKKARLRKNEQEELDDKYADELPEDEDQDTEDDPEKQLPEDEVPNANDEEDPEKQLPENEDPDVKDDEPQETESDEQPDPEAPAKPDDQKQEKCTAAHAEALKRKIVALKKENAKLRESNRKLAVRYENSLDLVANIVEHVESERKSTLIDEAIQNHPKLKMFREMLVKIPTVKELVQFLEQVKTQLHESAGTARQDSNDDHEALPGKNDTNGMTLRELSESAGKSAMDDPELNIMHNILHTLDWK